MGELASESDPTPGVRWWRREPVETGNGLVLAVSKCGMGEVESICEVDADLGSICAGLGKEGCCWVVVEVVTTGGEVAGGGEGAIAEVSRSS